MAIISEFGVSFVSRSLGVNISAKIEEFAVDRNNCHAFLSARSTSLVLVDDKGAKTLYSVPFFEENGYFLVGESEHQILLSKNVN